MRVLIRNGVVCVGVVYASVALSAPESDARELYQRAGKLDGNGEQEAAISAIEEGLAAAPADRELLRELLRLKGSVLLRLRDYTGALEAYEAYLDAGVTGANRRGAQKIVGDLRAVKSTFLDIKLANGPAKIYLDSRAYGVFCTAAPSCKRAILPGRYKVIAERPGFVRRTADVTVKPGTTEELAVALDEKPSLLTVRVAPPGARVTVDDAPHDAPGPVAAGTHRVVVSLAGHVEARQDAVAHEGNPIELEVVLEPLVPLRVEPPGAELRLDGKPVEIREGGIAVPPGAHGLVARARGFDDRRIEIPAVRGAGYALAIELPRTRVAVVGPHGPGRWPLRRKLALVVSGTGAAAMISGVALGLRSRQLEDRGYELCPSPETPCSDSQRADDFNLRARSRALQANIAYGAAGIAAITAAVLWLTRAPESRPAITPRLGAIAGLDLSMRF